MRAGACRLADAYRGHQSKEISGLVFIFIFWVVLFWFLFLCAFVLHMLRGCMQAGRRETTGPLRDEIDEPPFAEWLRLYFIKRLVRYIDH